MEKPYCKFCSSRHYTHESHIIKIDVTDLPINSPAVKKYAKILNDAFEKETQNKTNRPVKKWDRESWNAYMKDYMRRKRAEKRAKKNVS